MSDAAALLGHVAGQVGVEVATLALKQANEQQESVVALLEGVVEDVERAVEPGKGEHIDAHA